MVEVLRISALRRRRMSHSIYELSRPDFHVLQVVIEGAGQHFVDFDSVRLRTGDVLHVRPGQIQAFDESSRHEALCVLFRPNAVKGALPLELTHPTRPCAVRPHRRDFEVLIDLATLLESMAHRAVDIRTEHVAPDLLRAFLTTLAHLVEKRQPPPPMGTESAVDLVRAYERLVELHYLERHSATWFAAQLGVSVRTLSRACTAILNQTPKQHCDHRLTLEARRRLAHTDMTIETLSDELGFTEPTNFVKFFSRMTRQTPGEFRRQSAGRPGARR